MFKMRNPQMTIKTLMACVVAIALADHAVAEASQGRHIAGSLEQPPALPEDVANDEELEPTVTIKEQDEVTVYEYRLNGLLYAVKVVPKRAPAYYLVDTNGDGFFDRRRSDLTSPEINRIPAWVLFRW